ncbi:MAG: hypothetical protein H6558_19625 [Lewinellaceae bacterium]|nr:hypothetical protein [Lewinellaceae bacterium]
MKNLLLLFVFMAYLPNLSAQIQKGSVLLGGVVGINDFNEYGSNTIVFNLNPKLGFFLSDRFALGGGLDFALTASDVSDSQGSLGLNIFTRPYFNKSGMSRFFAQLDVGAQAPYLDDAQPDIYVAGGLHLGADFFLNEYVAIEGLLGYRRLHNFEFDAGINLIGLSFGVVGFIGGSK